MRSLYFLWECDTTLTVIYFLRIERIKLLIFHQKRWTQLANRRLQNWGGVPHPKGMLAEPLPSWLSPLVSRVAEVEVPARDDKQQR